MVVKLMFVKPVRRIFMADNFANSNNDVLNSGCFKEAVCIDAYRVYDSCGEKDCACCKSRFRKVTISSN